MTAPWPSWPKARSPHTVSMLYQLAFTAARSLKDHRGLEQAQAYVLRTIANRLDLEDQEIRQAFDNIIPPGKNNLTPAQRNAG